MTIEQKVEAYRMRLEGATLQSIADEMGVTKECIRRNLPPIEGKSWTADAVLSRCVYPGIAKWLYENRCTYAKLGELIMVPQATMSRWMNGVSKPTKSNIDKILEVTGLTYEQAFYEAEAPQPDEAVGQ